MSKKFPLKSFEFALNKIEDFTRSSSYEHYKSILLSLDLISAFSKQLEHLETGSADEKALATRARKIVEQYNQTFEGDGKSSFMAKIFKKLLGKPFRTAENALYKIHLPHKLTLKKRKVQHLTEETPLNSFLKAPPGISSQTLSLYFMKAILLLEKHFGACSKEARSLVRETPYTLHESNDPLKCHLIHTLYPFGQDTITIEAELEKNPETHLFTHLNAGSLQLNYHSRQTGFPTPLQADGWCLSEHLIDRKTFETTRGDILEILHPAHPNFSSVRRYFNEKKSLLENNLQDFAKTHALLWEGLIGKHKILSEFFKALALGKISIAELESVYLQLRLHFIEHPAAYLKALIFDKPDGHHLLELVSFQQRTLEEIQFDVPLATLSLAKALNPSFARLLLHPYQEVHLTELDLELRRLSIDQAKKFFNEIKSYQ